MYTIYITALHLFHIAIEFSFVNDSSCRQINLHCSEVKVCFGGERGVSAFAFFYFVFAF